jgi:hypothetical protein
MSRVFHEDSSRQPGLAAPDPIRTVAFVFLGLLAARVLGLVSVYFFEEDEVSLALGAAALVAKTSGHLYRYTVQLGYYRLVEGLDLLAGGRIDLIPWIMKGLSAIAGAWIPVVAFFAFRDELPIRRRWLIVLMLAVNPVVWRSSQYGNDAILSAALTITALVLLTNRVRGAAALAALALLGAGTLVRADAVLVLPAVFVLWWRAYDSLWSAIRATALWGICMAAVYGGAFLFDSRMDNALHAVSKHMLVTPNPTMFWEFLLWAMSPVPIVLAIWGARSLLERHGRILAVLAVWAVPTLIFYFRATTTCRYFLNVAVPCAVAAALGMDELVDFFRARWRAWIAWLVVGGAATVHLVIALGHVSPNRPAELFYGGTFPTHDGLMPTGALLARTYLTAGSLARSLPHPRFGMSDTPYWEGVSYGKAIDRIADPASPARNIVVLLGSGFPHAFHFHAHAAGARYLAGPSSPDLLWSAPTRFTLARASVLVVAGEGPGFASLMRLDVATDDLVWMVGDRPFPDAATLAKLPLGLTLVPIPTFDAHFRTFRVALATPLGG